MMEVQLLMLGGKELTNNLIKRDSCKTMLSNELGEEKAVQTSSGEKQGYSPVLIYTSYIYIYGCNSYSKGPSLLI